MTLFIPYYREFVSPYIWGGCSWNEFSMLYYFAGFNGYLLLGHYLRNHDWSLGKIVGIGIPMFVVAMPLLLRFPLYDRFACLHGGTVRVILLLLFSQCGDDDDSYLLAGEEGKC